MVVYADPLDTYGWGGGRGPDNDPYQSTPDAFKHNVSRMTADLTEGAQGVNRMTITATYTRSGGDSWGAWNFSTIERACAIADQYGLNIVLTINPQSPTTSDKVPLITSGVMLSWKVKLKEVFDHFAGPSATFKAGSVVHMQDGSDYTMSDSWPGITRFEAWNEPNQIGSAGGALAQGGSNQGRPWYDLVYIINRDMIDVAEAHPAWGTFEISGITMGGLEPDFLVGTGTAFGVLDWGVSKGMDWNRFHALSMHCYVKADPLTAVGGASNRGVLDTIRTHIRPYMNANGANLCDIWITEGGTGGSLSKGGTGLTASGALTEKWNQKQNYSSITGVGKSKTDTFWGHLFGDTGASGAQLAGDLSQPLILKNYVIKCHDMNAAYNTRISVICWHMLIRTSALTACEATNGSASGCGTAEPGASDYLYWQKARCTAEIYTADTDKNAYRAATGSPKRSPDWLPGARELHDIILSYSTVVSAPPSNTALPSVNQTTPRVGDVLVADPGTWDGSPAPTFTYQWQRDNVNVAGETGNTYDVTSADLGAQISVVVTATNSSGSDTAESVLTSAVTASSDAPTNVTAPSLSDADGALTFGGLAPPTPINVPNVGNTITLDPGTWSPTVTPEYRVTWQRRIGGVITDIEPLP